MAVPPPRFSTSKRQEEKICRVRRMFKAGKRQKFRIHGTDALKRKTEQNRSGCPTEQGLINEQIKSERRHKKGE